MKIGIAGVGYVGLVSGCCFSEFGFDVLCVDTDKKKISNLNNNIIPIYEPGLKTLVGKNKKAGRLTFSDNIETLKDSDIIFIAVGTPTRRRGDGHADLHFVFKVVEQLSAVLQSSNYTLIVTKSTVPIGTGKKIKDLISKIRPDLLVGTKFDVASNPEFLREGSAIEDFMRPDRVVCGVDTNKARDKLSKLYRPLNLRETNILFTDIESAELIKYASNAFLATKISFINEIADLCEKVGGDVQDVSKGMGLDRRIGSKFLHPGPGFGGSCFPKDIRALYATFLEHNSESVLIKAVIEYNEKRKLKMIQIIEETIGVSMKGKVIAILGITFKPNTDDIREAPSLSIIPELINRGAIVRAYDPAGIKNARLLKEFKNVEWFKNSTSALTGADALVLLTEWNEFRGLSIEEVKRKLNHPVIIDLRNIFKHNIMKSLGIKYRGIGYKPE